MSGRLVLQKSRWIRLGMVVFLAGAAMVPTATDAAVPDDPVSIPPACAASLESDPVEGVAHAESLLAGTWIRCDGAVPLFAVDESPHVGMEFTAERRFFRIHEDTDGSLIRAEGALQQGDRDVGDVNGFVSTLTMSRSGSGTFHAGASFLNGAVRDDARWSGPEPELGVPTVVETGPCGPLAPPMVLDDVAAATDAVVGTWIRCEGSSVFAAIEGDDVGLELAAVGGFFRLYESADGLIRGQGLRQEGRWLVNDVYTAMDPPASWSDLGLRLAGGGYFPVGVTVHDQDDDGVGDVLRLSDSMSGAGGGYVRWFGAPPVPGVPPGVGGGPCGSPTDPVELASSDQLTDLLVGAWTVCEGEPFGTGVIGAEFAADGTFRAYVHSADGQVVVDERSVGATWHLWPFDGPFDVHNGPQIDVVYADGSTRIVQPDVFASPLFMSMWPDWGLLAGAPEPLPLPVDSLPPTGGDASTNMLLTAGALVSIGLLAIRSARRPSARQGARGCAVRGDPRQR